VTERDFKMQFFSIKRTMVALGAVAALAVGTGIIPNATNHTPTAQAAELSQHGGNQGGGHNGGGGQNFRGNGGGHQGGGHGSFQGRNYRSSYNFSHTYWGYGFHNYYPQYYVTYYYEPVSVCGSYYFDDDDGVWYCFNGD
jgi:uncharacterized membrane protein